MDEIVTYFSCFQVKKKSWIQSFFFLKLRYGCHLKFLATIICCNFVLKDVCDFSGLVTSLSVYETPFSKRCFKAIWWSNTSCERYVEEFIRNFTLTSFLFCSGLAFLCLLKNISLLVVKNYMKYWLPPGRTYLRICETSIILLYLID